MLLTPRMKGMRLRYGRLAQPQEPPRARLRGGRNSWPGASCTMMTKLRATDADAESSASPNLASDHGRGDDLQVSKTKLLVPPLFSPRSRLSSRAYKKEKENCMA